MIGEKCTPLLGINVGTLGFLTEVTEDNIFPSLELLLRGEFQIEERNSLRVDFLSGAELSTHYALNDVIVTRSTTSRIFEIDTFVSDEYLSRVYE